MARPIIKNYCAVYNIEVIIIVIINFIQLAFVHCLYEISIFMENINVVISAWKNYFD